MEKAICYATTKIIFALLLACPIHSDENHCCSRIAFLRGAAVHQDSRIVVSALPDEQDENGKWIYFYGCETTLKNKNVTTVAVPCDESGVEDILTKMLAQRKRSLTAPQSQHRIAAAK